MPHCVNTKFLMRDVSVTPLSARAPSLPSLTQETAHVRVPYYSGRLRIRIPATLPLGARKVITTCGWIFALLFKLAYRSSWHRVFQNIYTGGGAEIAGRENGVHVSLLPQFPLYHLLDCYQCAKSDDHLSYGEMEMPVPPFGCTFSTAPDLQHILAVANEEGFVRLYNTQTQASDKQIFREWQAHSNAVFDLTWVPGEHKIVTVSGDQTAKVWDVKTAELLGVCRGHQCSLKSVAFSKFESAVFCTGGRDGNIMVWDTRCNKKDGFYRQVKQISGAHNIMDKQIPSKLKKKKQSGRGLAPSVDFQQSVTVVVLQDEHTLISAGAVDGVIKVWDLRKSYTTYRQDLVPSRSFSYPGTSTRKLGYSSLVLDSTGTSLFANCTDDIIYKFNMSSPKDTPVSAFSGHQNSSFYVKSGISPDDQFLISGSSDQSAYIWKVSEPQLPPVMLLGHMEEVTSVAWCPSDFSKIATCSDDNTIRVWRLRRGKEEKILDRSSLVGWACLRKAGEQNETETLSSQQSTPAKVTTTGSPPISSPQPAACAPAYMGDLPLPTNTPTSSVKTTAPVAYTPARQREAASGPSPKSAPSSIMSIRQWVTQTPNSSPPSREKKTLSPRKALAEISQILPRVPFTSKSIHLRLETRAKRRLESSRDSNAKRKYSKSCNCVTDLDQVPKKSRLEQYTMTGNSKPCGEDCLTLNELAKATQSQKEPTSPRYPCSPSGSPNLPVPHKISCGGVADKENGSADKNWLSALKDKLRTNKSSNQNTSGNSVQSPQSCSMRQQEPGAGIGSPASMDQLIATTNTIYQSINQKLDSILDVLKDIKDQANTTKSDGIAGDSPSEETAQDQEIPTKEKESQDKQQDGASLQQETAIDQLLTKDMNVRDLDFYLYKLPKEFFYISLEDLKGGKFYDNYSIILSIPTESSVDDLNFEPRTPRFYTELCKG
uniref:denticleless protein homolog n=1 Tax=Euleptes europaea TaxID=460621 RepID=UPI00253FBCAB|nr:denticleless protein homolog [Euleptes europaea]